MRAQALRFGQPQHGVQIAQASWASLDVGFQLAGRATGFVMALALFQ